MNSTELAEELGLELEHRVVVMDIELPTRLWELLDITEKTSNITTQEYLTALMSKTLAEKFLEFFKMAGIIKEANPCHPS
jgi:hypothetical protein